MRMYKCVTIKGDRILYTIHTLDEEEEEEEEEEERDVDMDMTRDW
jgi:hypothetical protein